jgi:hypothetical protein
MGPLSVHVQGPGGNSPLLPNCPLADTAAGGGVRLSCVALMCELAFRFWYTALA